jgi:hypothetical protein
MEKQSPIGICNRRKSTPSSRFDDAKPSFGGEEEKTATFVRRAWVNRDIAGKAAGKHGFNRHPAVGFLKLRIYLP